MSNLAWKYYVVLCHALYASLNVLLVQSAYSAQGINYGWGLSKQTCEVAGKELAKVSSPSELTAAKAVFISNQFPKKYWIGLMYNSDFTWSDGTRAKRGVEGVDSILSPAEVSATTTRCFYVTDTYNTLLSQDCNQAEKFICQTKELVSTSSASITPSTSAASVAASTLDTTQATVAIGELGRKEWDPYVLIVKDVKSLEALNSSDSSSLKKAVNTTSEMLQGLKRLKKDGRGTANLLIAIDELERFALEYAEKHLPSSNISIKTEVGHNFVVILQKVPLGVAEAVAFPSPEGRPWPGAVVLPSNLFITEERYAVLVVFYDVHQLLPGRIYDNIDGNRIDGLQLFTSIMSTSVSPAAPGSLEEDIDIIFRHEKDGKRLGQRHCVFWNFSDRTAVNGSWSSKGCHVKTVKANETVCSCNHMTSFAVLLQVRDTEVPKGHKLALEVITYIGCVLSLLGEILTALAYIILLKVSSEEIQIRLNLVVSLAAAHTVFLAGINATENQAGCIFVAVLLHYLFLVAFDWMLLEGILLYLKVVKVFNIISKITLLYVFAWGFPISVVLLSILIASGSSDGVGSYANTKFCWVSFSNGLVWTFATPVMVIVTINIIIIARVLGEMTKMQNINTKEVNDARQGIRTCVILCPLLGVTWIFGILSVTDAGLFFQYTFTILNSMQGFFIFIFHVVRNSDVRAAFQRKKQRWRLQRTNFSENSSGSHHHSAQRQATSRNQIQALPLKEYSISQEQNCSRSTQE